MSGRKIMYRKDYLEGNAYGSNQSQNAVENERNGMIFNNNLHIVSSYGSPFSKKGSPVKIKIIK